MKKIFRSPVGRWARRVAEEARSRQAKRARGRVKGSADFMEGSEGLDFSTET
jgi:hypothetical protein